MLLLDEFWSHSWFNWLKLAKKNSKTLVFPFCYQPQEGQSCPTVDMSLAEAAGSMVWQGAWGPERPCGPRREGHGHGAHPGSPCLPPLLLKASQTCGSVVGNSEWPKPELWQAALGMCPTEHCAPQSPSTALSYTWPCCFWDVSLPPPGMQCWLKTLFIMKDTLSLLCSSALVLAMRALLPAKPCNCVCSHIHGIPVQPSPWQPLIQHSIKMQWTCVLLGLLPIQLSFCVLWSLSQ